MTSREPPVTLGRGGVLGHHAPRWLTHRVDALYLAFKGPVRDECRAELTTLHARMSVTKSEAAVRFEAGGGVLQGAMSTRSREGWWLVRSAWVSIVVDERAVEGWSVVAQPSALLLMREGPRRALELARSAARAVLSNVVEERVRRLDLCADVVGFEMQAVERHAFLTHRRTQSADISTVREYARAGKRTGFVFGKGDAVVRVYDKTEHLRLGLDDTKADDERADWVCAGWNGRDDVTRIEYQLRGRMLKELELRDPEKCLERLDAVWSYCTRKWLRLVELVPGRRRERCATDERWSVLEDVVFRARSEAAKRVRAPSAPHARRMVSAVVNYMACEGLLAIYTGDARERVANWSNARAEAWIQEALFSMARQTSRAAAADLIQRFDDACEAAAHLMEKQSAASARFTMVAQCIDDVAGVAA
jgi:hypothetical protein